jgi:hypothetical protein
MEIQWTATGTKAKGSTTIHDGEVRIWQKWKTTMGMKPSVSGFVEGARLIPVLKENYYFVLEGKAVSQNQNRAAIAARVMSGTNMI